MANPSTSPSSDSVEDSGMLVVDSRNPPSTGSKPFPSLEKEVILPVNNVGESSDPA